MEMQSLKEETIRGLEIIRSQSNASQSATCHDLIHHDKLEQ